MDEVAKFYSPDGPERCGFVLKDGSVIETRNVNPDSQNGFDMDAEEIIKYVDDVAATWHTHPSQSANLSKDDMGTFLAWPELRHIIVGSDGLRVYKVHGSTVVNDTP